MDKIAKALNTFVVAVLELLIEDNGQPLPATSVYLATHEQLGWDLDTFWHGVEVLNRSGIFSVRNDQIYPGPRFEKMKAALLDFKAKHGVKS